MYRQLSKQILGKENSDTLGNELSAPYEIPQFPIEQIQSKLQRVRGDGSKVSWKIMWKALFCMPTKILNAHFDLFSLETMHSLCVNNFDYVSYSFLYNFVFMA